MKSKPEEKNKRATQHHWHEMNRKQRRETIRKMQSEDLSLAELKTMAAWLQQCRIRTVAMQSTGVYGVAVYDILEQAGLEVYLVNARDTKNLPGRKSDVQESQWLMKLSY